MAGSRLTNILNFSGDYLDRDLTWQGLVNRDRSKEREREREMLRVSEVFYLIHWTEIKRATEERDIAHINVHTYSRKWFLRCFTVLLVVVRENFELTLFFDNTGACGLFLASSQIISRRRRREGK